MTDIVQTVKGLVNEVRALKAIGDTQAVADLQATLDAANADLNAAIADANGRIDTLDNTTLPGLTNDLQQAQKDITAAQSTLSDHDKALATAQDQLAGTQQSGLGDKVNDAAQAASDAAGAAAGKSDVLIQSDTPVAAYQRSTTLWINTTGGANTPMQWDGSKWVAVTDSKAIAAANAAAKAQSTADMALANAENLVVNGSGGSMNNTWGNNGVTSDGTVFSRTFPGGEIHVDFLYGSLSKAPIQGRVYRISIDVRLASGVWPGGNFVFGVGSNWRFVPVTSASSDWETFTRDYTVPTNTNAKWFMSSYMSSTSGSGVIQFRNLSIYDVTAAAQAAQSANTAQVTANGKNRIITSVSEPSHTGLVAGDTWRQINNTTDRHVTAYKVWNRSAFVPDYMDLDSLAVAGSLSAKSANIESLNAAIAAILKLDVGNLIASDATVDTAVINKLAVGIATVIKLNAGTITTGQLGADRIDVNNLAAKIATILKLDVSNLIASDAVIDSAVVAKIAAQIITANLLQTSAANPRSWMDSSGFHTTDKDGNKTFDTTAGQTPLLTGGFQTALSGDMIKIVEDPQTHQGQIVGVNSQGVTVFTIYGTLYDDGYNGLNVVLNNHDGTNATLQMKNNSAENGGSTIDIYADTFKFGGKSMQLLAFDDDGSGAPEIIDYTPSQWVHCMATSYYTPTPNFGYPALSVCKRGGIVYLCGVVKSAGTVKANSNMGVMIPPSYRPSVRTYCGDNKRVVPSGGECVVDIDGSVIWGPASNGVSYIVLNGSWPLV